MDPSSHGGGAADGSADGHSQILWDWTAEHCEPNGSSHADATKFVWDCLNQDDDELLGLLGNQTPLRDCRNFFADLGDITCKETLDLEESRESKRRRTLEYPSESSQSEVGTHGTGSPFVTPEVAEISLLCADKPQSLNCDMHNTSNNLDEAPYHQEDNLLEHCSYETPVYLEPDQTQESIACINDQAGISGTTEIAPMTESFIMQETRKLSTLKVSKGPSSSLVRVKENLTISVAYPFTLIKPSWEEGDVTLQDINQRIRAPPKKAPEILGTSAFSGKPVIGKTRIRTEGGKGSITILRTKG
ncbi:protein XRI1 isoform X3 [Sorghum bicolor]|uniref:protein XRI1 isoform X3 n=1 Tax=Sorghum bicolor TaxID=4558 RepID=UPI000B4267ED|nr:protein XRI1 isoform X3 [Sorghum bicolor]|eukprot:XP_021318224.1 protein XRI1 isoform X3 [Sorghum bicolor]